MLTSRSSVLVAAFGVLSLLQSAPVSAQYGGELGGIELPGERAFGGIEAGFDDPYGSGSAGEGLGGDPMATTRKKPDGTVHVHLKDGAVIVGKLAAVKALKLKSAFGEVAIPTQRIASLQFGQDTTSTRVMLRNGDRVTGELEVDKILLKAVWGEIAVDTKHVLGIVSRDLADGYRRVKRRVVGKNERGERVVRLIEELVPVNRGHHMPGYGDPDAGYGAYGGGGDPYQNTEGVDEGGFGEGEFGGEGEFHGGEEFGDR